ncbi:MAG: NAD-dependent epimerase/dehydratase family protein [Bacteroidota bacterium]
MLTGGSGMVGQNLIRSKPNHIQVLAPPRSEVDLLDFNSVLAYINLKKPDLIIHSAGLVGGIAANMSNQVEFLIQNTEIGKNVVLAAQKCRINNLLNLGSSCIYPKNVEGSLKESMMMTGKLEPTNEGYALAKIFIVSLCRFIVDSYESFNYKTIIPCNLYGMWDNFDPISSHMIPAVIRKIHVAKMNKLPSVEIWGNGKARREFMYAGDLADFIWTSINKFNDLPDLMNIGIGEDRSIREYYQVISDVIGYDGEFTFDLSKPVGMKRKLVDISLQSNFGWSSPTSLDKGIELTYNFFKKNEQ